MLKHCILTQGFVQVLNSLGIAMFHKGRIDDAINSFQVALKIKPDYTEAQNNLQQMMQIRKENIK